MATDKQIGMLIRLARKLGAEGTPEEIEKWLEEEIGKSVDDLDNREASKAITEYKKQVEKRRDWL